MMARLQWYLFGLNPLSPLKKKKKKKKRKVKFGPPLTKLSGSARGLPLQTGLIHIRTDRNELDLNRLAV